MGSTSVRIRLIKLSAIFLIVLVLNCPQYLRCYNLTGSPLGLRVPDKVPRQQLMIEQINLPGTLANALRKVSLHFGTPSAAVNLRVERGFRFAIRALGVNPDDPKAIFLGEDLEE
jgi:hypothetical protein